MGQSDWFSGFFLFAQERCVAGVSILQFLPTDDAFVDNFGPNQNFGSEADLYIGNRSMGETCRSYLKFDINPIPEGATIVNAQLVLNANGESDCYISAHNVIDTFWSEDLIIWDNAPGFEPVPTFDVYYMTGSAWSFA